MATFRLAAALLLVFGLSCTGFAEEFYEGTDPQTGYRIGAYRGPTPANAPGAARLDSAQARRLHGEGVAFIDVLGVPGVEPDPLTGAWAFDRLHETIPGAAWVPNIGTGTLSAQMESYFRKALLRLAGLPPGRPVVIFCQRDCWMSWNAAKRAASWGYASVSWYPDGTDGWRESGWPLAPAANPEPAPVD